MVKNPPANAGDARGVDFIPGSGRSAGEGSSVLAWKISWTEESGGLHSTGSIQARILEWIAVPSSRGSSRFWDQLAFSALQADSLLQSLQGSAIKDEHISTLIPTVALRGI